MEELLNKLLEDSKKDKKQLIALKNLAVKSQNYELGVKLREIEHELFPETEEQKESKKQAKKLNLIFRMVDLNISEDTCWLISETIKQHNEKKEQFSIDDASKLICKRQEIFDKD